MEQEQEIYDEDGNFIATKREMDEDRILSPMFLLIADSIKHHDYSSAMRLMLTVSSESASMRNMHIEIVDMFRRVAGHAIAEESSLTVRIDPFLLADSYTPSDMVATYRVKMGGAL